MENNRVFNFSLEEIEAYDLDAIEEKVLYLRYLIRRETQENKLIKYQLYLEHLEHRSFHLLSEMPNAKKDK